ncbi:MAG: DNA alkylation repair protein [Bacilli bacterium]|nr:DNA alkylation repair protein [Bacilli bacterium]
MNLIKNKWTKEDVIEFDKYLYSLRREEKINWTKNIVCTKMDTLAIVLPDLKKMAKEIYKGDYISYLDLMPHKHFESLITDAFLISLIKDYKVQIKYINKLIKFIDSWSVTDTLKFSIKNHEDEYLEYAKELIKSNETYARRTGIRILFSYTRLDNYIDQIFNIVDSLKNEEKYYVNMAVAWLLCELMIKQRNKTIKYLERHNLNKFTINKMISKCRDSFRVSILDKELLLKYKVK